MSTQSNESNPIFTPIKYGAALAKNRIVLAPLTRIRADTNLCPTELHQEYYAQRADDNLLITEATVIAPQSIASHHIPACFNEQQAKAWKKVTDAVHAKGAIISLQAWHQGRASHRSYTNHPLAKAANAEVGESSCEIALSPWYQEPNCDTLERVPHQQPKMMTIDDIERFKQQHVDASDLALNVAGFDLYELHGAHGYLFDQFLNSNSNTRTDKYGGSLENRFRLLGEVLDILTAQHPQRIAVRISPYDNGTGGYHDMNDEDPETLYKYVYERLSDYDLAYVLNTEPRWDFKYQGNPENDTSASWPLVAAKFCEIFRKKNKTTKLIGCGGFTPESALGVMSMPEEKRPYDAIGFGRWYISNPDMVYRLKKNLPLTRYNRSTFYTAPPFDEEQIFPVGYTDYPSFAEVAKKEFGADVNVDEVALDQGKVAQIVQKYKDQTYALIPTDVIGTSKSTASRDVAANL
jgi:N-ethylmaleimide reductase